MVEFISKINKVEILNTQLLNISLSELLEKFNEGVLITPNVDQLIKLQSDSEFYTITKQTEYLICDSKIVQLGLKFLGCPVREVIPGSSFFPSYYNYHKDNESIKIFLLGAAEGVAINAKNKINDKIGREIIVGAHSPSFGFEENEEENKHIIDIINQSGATVLVVGVGAPKQEKWIFKYKDKLKYVKTFMALGATIDFEAGNLKRAPKWIQNLSLEWLYRLLKEPKRLWKRYLIDDLPFFYLIFLQKIKKYKDPFK